MSDISYLSECSEPSEAMCWAIYSINNVICLLINTDMCEVNNREEDNSHATLGRMTYIINVVIITDNTVRLVSVRG
jgi:hypothetical protein